MAIVQVNSKNHTNLWYTFEQFRVNGVVPHIVRGYFKAEQKHSVPSQTHHQQQKPHIKPLIKLHVLALPGHSLWIGLCTALHRACQHNIVRNGRPNSILDKGQDFLQVRHSIGTTMAPGAEIHIANRFGE